jgi:hypothetical protein
MATELNRREELRKSVMLFGGLRVT